MDEELLKALKSAINSFEKIKNVELIATFGSMAKLDSSKFDDLDIISICKKDIHDLLITHLVHFFTKKGYEVLVFQSVKDKPSVKKSSQILLHDLTYSSLSNLVRVEWKSVINTMKSEMVVLWGDKDYNDRLPFFKITKKELLKDIISWSKNIDSLEEFNGFKKYLIKIIPRLIKEYNYLEIDSLKQIQEISKESLDWKYVLEKINSILLL